MALHNNEFLIDDALVSKLVAEQLPDLSGLELRRIETSGTVNVMYRLGDDKVVRLPRTSEYSDGPEREARWIPRFAPLLPLAIPEYLALGKPTDQYLSHWSVLSWIDGTVANGSTIADLSTAAEALGQFVVSLRNVPTDGAPKGGSYRGFGLQKVDVDMRRWVEQLPEDIDRNTVIRVWESCLAADDWTGPPTWFHSDLRGDNLIARNGSLVGVIDWEGCTVGDPSADYLAAWWLFDGDSREVFRRTSRAEPSGWQRAMGWALLMSVAAIPYYAKTNPLFVDQARRALSEVLSDRS